MLVSYDLNPDGTIVNYQETPIEWHDNDDLPLNMDLNKYLFDYYSENNWHPTSNEMIHEE